MAFCCALCGKGVDAGRGISIKAACPHCGRDLHICLNCRFYSENSHNNCTEPRSDMQRNSDRANFCDWFQYSDGPSQKGGVSSGSKEEARKNFEDLFRKQ